ncbi:MAG: MBOAT family protein [Butyricicoccus sp.]|nr:MBOAT family protein [Butyricicoccus sp.]
MQFNSHIFLLIFLPVAVIGTHLLRRRGTRQVCLFLAAMSVWFYLAGSPEGIFLLGASIYFNYYMGRSLQSAPGRGKLAVGIGFNLAALGVLKYTDFVLGSAFGLFGAEYTPLHFLIPLGLSFFTFQQIAYLCDCSKGEGGDYTPFEYALYVLFFPTILSGPIAFHHEIIPQLRVAKPETDWNALARGLTRVSLGLAKKVLIADVLGTAVAAGFGLAGGLSSPAALLTMLGYTLQLDFDFSGYCDIASGCALMLGVELPVNFNAPYRACSVTEFWKRWHMTLTRFFTRYLYIGLGGSRGGLKKTCLNVMIVFLLSGIWHGAGWTFLIWGAMHGIMMVIERVRREKGCKALPRPLGWALTFLFVNVAWVFFRAASFEQAFALLGDLLAGGFKSPTPTLTGCYLTAEIKVINQILGLDQIRLGVIAAVLITGGALALSTLPRKTVLERTDENFRPTVLTLLAAAFLLFWSALSFSGVGSFLYFTF